MVHLKLVFHPGEAAFVKQASEVLDRGFLLTIDYGADFEALLDTLEEDGSRRRGDEDQQEKIEDLAGFNLSPDRGVFKSEEAEWARSRLSEWIQDQSIEVGRLNAHLTGARLPYLMEMCLAGDRGRRGVSQMGGVHQRHRNL